MNTDTKTVGHPDRFAFNENGSCDWHTSAGLCLDRAKAMVDMIYGYVSSNRGSFPDLYTNTLEAQLHAINAELNDVGKLIEGWHDEQWKKERDASKEADA